MKICAILIPLLLVLATAVPQSYARAHHHHVILLPGETEPVYHEKDILRGTAAWYGERLHGNKTSSGERFDCYALTAAHRTLPFGTRVRVTNLQNKKSVIVRITDRGPLSSRFIIDLSKGSAKVINMIRSGIAPVSLEIMELPEWYRQKHPRRGPVRHKTKK